MTFIPCKSPVAKRGFCFSKTSVAARQQKSLKFPDAVYANFLLICTSIFVASHSTKQNLAFRLLLPSCASRASPSPSKYLNLQTFMFLLVFLTKQKTKSHPASNTHCIIYSLHQMSNASFTHYFDQEIHCRKTFFESEHYPCKGPSPSHQHKSHARGYVRLW